MPLSLTLLIVSIILLLIYLILYWASYVPIKSQTDETPEIDADNAPSISVVIITHDSDALLERVIDEVASQDYPNFEIVVVNNASTDNTNDVIKRCSAKYPNLLRHTYLPQNRNGIIHMSIATTLGVRASRKEWVVILRPTSSPKSSQWLRSFANAIQQGYSLCLGYNEYYGYDNSSWVKKAKSWRRKAQILNYRAINRGKRMPIEAENTNIAFRKEDFLTNGGYGRWLDIKNDHEVLYATTYYPSNTTTLLTQADAQVETILPPIEDLWDTDKSLMKKAYKRLSKFTKLRRNYYTTLTILYLFTFLILCSGIGLTYYLLPFDNSLLLINEKIYLDYSLPYLGDEIPLIPLCTIAIYVITSLTHLIVKSHKNKRDIKNLTVPLKSNPLEDFNDENLF